MLEWRISEDDRALVLIADGVPAAEISRWSFEGGATAWWSVTVRGTEGPIADSLRQACCYVFDALDVPPIMPPGELLEEHGESAEPPAAPAPTAVTAGQPGVFRVGRHVPRNVYRGDEPVFMAATANQARELVALLNAGVDARRAGP